MSFANATKLGTIVRNMVAPSTGNVLFGNTRQSILALTFLRPDESFYLREIVRRTGHGTGSVQRELKLLTDCGILRKDREKFFQANSKSPIYEPLKQIIIRTVGLGERLRGALNGMADRIAVAFIFGSFPRGEQHQLSDVDVLVIANDEQVNLDEVNSALSREQDQIGREINPFVLSATQWQSKQSAGNPFVRRVLDGEKFFLIGGNDELERLAEKRLAQTSSANKTGTRRSARDRRKGSEKRKSKRS